MLRERRTGRPRAAASHGPHGTGNLLREPDDHPPRREQLDSIVPRGATSAEIDIRRCTTTRLGAVLASPGADRWSTTAGRPTSAFTGAARADLAAACAAGRRGPNISAASWRRLRRARQADAARAGRARRLRDRGAASARRWRPRRASAGGRRLYAAALVSRGAGTEPAAWLIAAHRSAEPRSRGRRSYLALSSTC